MRIFGALVTVILGSLILVSLFPMIDVDVKAQPRTDLEVTWWACADSGFNALRNDLTDVLDWDLTKLQKSTAEADPNLQIVAVTGNGMFEFDLNNNATIKDYPGKLNPMSVKEVRQAFAYLVDKDYIIANILEYFGVRIDAPVSDPQTVGWVNESVVTFDWNHDGAIQPSEDNYPYPYNPDAAAALLASIGFNDTDGNGYLNYPSDAGVWMGAAGIDTTAMPIKFMIRSDDGYRMSAGRYAYGKLEGNPAVAGDSVLALSPVWATYGMIGGDFDTTDETWVTVRSILRTPVLIEFNYHIYTGGQSLGRFPTHLFKFYHSTFSYSGGSNYVTDSAHPTLDTYLEGIQYAANTGDAQTAAKLATGYFVSNAVSVSLWSFKTYYAWRKEVAGVVNMKSLVGGYPAKNEGPANDFTFLNAYRTTNQSAPLRFGSTCGWTLLNILYSSWYFEYDFLDRVYTGLIKANPYDLSVDVPWVAQDWDVGTWLDGTTTKTKVTYYLRKDVGAAQPATGGFSGVFTARDLEFTIWYNYAYADSWWWSNFKDVHHTKVLNDYTLEVYFDDLSMWLLYAPTYPLLGPYNVLREKLGQVTSASFAAPAVGSEIQFGGTLPIDGVVQVVNATSDVDGALVEGNDYHIRSGYDVVSHNVFVNDGGVTPGATITLFYWKGIPDGAAGEYLGGNLGFDWTDTMYAYGAYYPVSIGTMTAKLNRNPYFFLETPLLGEIDWRWNWIGTTKPRSGNFKIDILDVVKATGAYSSRGDGVYNPTYLPGADLDANDLCHIGILDLVLITSKYAETFGQPP